MAITSSDSTSFTDTIGTAGSAAYYYAVSAFDKGNNESPPTPVARGTVHEMFALGGKLLISPSLSISLPNDENVPVLVGFRLPERVFVSLDLLERKVDTSETLTATLTSGSRDAGTYVVGIPMERIKSGRYVVRLTAADTMLEELLIIRR